MPLYFEVKTRMVERERRGDSSFQNTLRSHQDMEIALHEVQLAEDADAMKESDVIGLNWFPEQEVCFVMYIFFKMFVSLKVSYCH